MRKEERGSLFLPCSLDPQKILRHFGTNTRFQLDKSNTFPASHVDGRQALLVSVSDFLFGFVSDTDTDTLNICQTKKTQKNSETVMLFRGRLH